MKLALAAALLVVLGAAQAAHHANMEGTWDVTLTIDSDASTCTPNGFLAAMDDDSSGESGNDDGSDGSDGEEDNMPIQIDEDNPVTLVPATGDDPITSIVLHFHGIGAGYEALKLAVAATMDDGESSWEPDPNNEVEMTAAGTVFFVGQFIASLCPAEDGESPAITDSTFSEFDDGSSDDSDGEDGEGGAAASVAASAILSLAAAVAVSKAQL